MKNAISYNKKLFITAACKLLVCSFFFGVQAQDSVVQSDAQVIKAKGTQSWTLLTYMQADNSLADFASYNITAMQKGMLDDTNVNMLVQWDQPGNNKTWRYRIVRGGKIEDASLSLEMGTNPSQEIVDSMQWAITKYPADHYGLILWNHGSGIEDYCRSRLSVLLQKHIHSWMELPGLPHKTLSEITDGQRGILYDDSQNTCLTNQGLYNAMSAIKTMLGKNIDIIGMDACLMAMIEVCYQVRQFADVFVGSQQTEPGEGWNYRSFLAALTAKPSLGSLGLATSIVQAYKEFYKYHPDARDFTLSAVRMDTVAELKSNIDDVANGIMSCMRYDAQTMTSILSKARKASIEMYSPEYIDIYSFCTALLNQLQRTAPKSAKFLQNNRPLSKPMTPEFQRAANSLGVCLTNSMKCISKAVVMSASGPALANVKGLSIYYPSKGNIDSSYANTLFARDSAWMTFLRSLRA